MNKKKVQKDKKFIEKIRIPIRVLMSIFLFSLLFFLAKELIHNTESITNLTKSAGPFAPIALIAIISLGIIFTPIPSVILIILAGYLYGPILGGIYSYIAHMIAATGTFLTTNTLKIKIQNKKYEKYKEIIKKNTSILYFLYLIPILPVSVISVLSASSNMKWKKFLKITLISFAPLVFFFSFFGNKINTQNLLLIGIFLLIMLISLYIITKIIKKKYKLKKIIPSKQ